MNKKLLITGFMPFGTETINPSWEAVRRLPDTIGSYDLYKLELPVVFGEAADYAWKVASDMKSDVILCIGQAAGRSAITPEMIGINLRMASIPDNAGYMPQDAPIIAGAPAAYFSTIPVRKITEAIQAAGIPATVSCSAGSYVCNDLLYTLLHRSSGTTIKTGFIHLPLLPEQAKNNQPCLPLDEMIRALIIAISIFQEEYPAQHSPDNSRT